MQRLRAILQVMTPCQILIDIGCDHGYLGIASLEQNLTQTVWNVDIKPQPLKMAQINVAKHKLTDKTTFFLSNGFEQLPKTINNQTATVVCAGMGTNLILKVLAELPNYVTQVICLTHTLGQKIRYWAQDKQFYVLHEQYVREKQNIYELIVLTNDFNLSNLTYQTPQDFLMGLKQFWLQCYQELIDYWKIQKKIIDKIPKKLLTANQDQQLVFINQILKDANDH